MRKRSEVQRTYRNCGMCPNRAMNVRKDRAPMIDRTCSSGPIAGTIRRRGTFTLVLDKYLVYPEAGEELDDRR